MIEYGKPEAKIARPFVHFWAISAVHSDLEVGLDNGKIMGGESWNENFVQIRVSIQI